MAAGVGRPRHRRRPRALAHRTGIKAAIAAAAGVDPRPELERALRAGIVTDEPAAAQSEQTKRCRRSGGSDDQLSMW
ncbi:hypothetical protein JO861_03585 [Rhodococcus hoagii]|uniref:hypothetical protein n=1 Tax=Rhodococcus hoagii TaxID=43767 RepID=UPI0007CD6D7F|nr:hypothetical protein [Prescottella equi]MBM9835627.1 hypothetical protein [Prescottella equi]NKS76856.1 hypothetical protein [Prescottella equi]UNQ37772.1 hypothetical protein MPC38_13430 [Prescottella equi]